jgi:hypothetical protein
MSNYINSVITVSLVASIACAIAPEGKGIGRYIKFVTALMTLLVIIAPLSLLIGNKASHNAPGDGSDTLFTPSETTNEDTTDYREAIVAAAVDKMKETVISVLATRYDVRIGDVSVELEYDASDYSNIIVTHIYVTLTGYSSWIDAEDAADYIGDLFACPVTIGYD